MFDTVLLRLLLVAAALWIAADGRHHWDEPTYLYAGAYVDTADILSGEVQPSGVAHFTQGRILHALIAKAVMSAAGSPQLGRQAMIALNLALVCASIALLYRLLRELLPGCAWLREAVALVALSPVVLYLAFKPLADNEALAAALLATFALLRLARGGGLGYAALATAGIAACALCKNQMAWMPATFWASFCLVPIAGIGRGRLAWLGAASGLAAIALTVGVLEWLGIGVEAYWSSYRDLTSGDVPVVAKFVNVGTELGLAWLLLPFALLSTRRRELIAFGTWLLLAMAPFVLLIDSIEARHIAVNLVAAGALFALALEAIATRFALPQATASGRGRVVAVVAVAALLATHAAVLAIMPHRVDTDEMRRLQEGLDARFGAGRYVLLTAAGYTDFHLMRVLWPGLDVRDASTANTFVHEGARGRAELLDRWYAGRQLESLAELQAVGKPVVYVGYRQTFAAENLHDMLARISPNLANRTLGQVNLVDRLFSPATRWLWDDPRVRMEPVTRVGHYHAYEVRVGAP